MTALLPALFMAVVLHAVPACAGTVDIHAARDQRKDVDAGGTGGRAKPEAVLLRANQLPARTLGGARHSVALRALLCEASFIPFAPDRRRILRKEQLRSDCSPVVIIHFPRPPPFCREIV